MTVGRMSAIKGGGGKNTAITQISFLFNKGITDIQSHEGFT